MPKKEIDCKEILRLHGLGMSQDKITKLLHISKKSASDVIRAAGRVGIDYKKASGMDGHSLYRELFPDRRITQELRCQPPFVMVHEWLIEPDATLRSCWEEYRAMCTQSGTIPVQYSTFCAGYGRFCAENDLPNRTMFRPGMTCQAAWAPQALEFTDAYGKAMKAYLFVGYFPFSGHIFFELKEQKDEDAFVRCIGHMIRDVRGIPRTVSVLHARDPGAKRLKACEIVVSERLLGLTDAGITDIRKDKDGAADSVSSLLLSKVEECGQERSLSSIISVLTKTADRMNLAAEPDFMKEKMYFNPPSDNMYDVVTISKKDVKIQNNSHVKYGGNYYSAPWQYRGRTVQVRHTDTGLFLYCRGDCIAKHRRVPDFVRRKYVTDGKHMPPENERPAFNMRRLQSWANSIGRNTGEMVRIMFSRVEYEEQAYNTVTSLLQISKVSGPGYLDMICGKALMIRENPSYATVLEVMQNEPRS